MLLYVVCRLTTILIYWCRIMRPLTLGINRPHNEVPSRASETLETGSKVVRKKQVPTGDGNFIEGTVMPFQTGGEHWNEYLVEDGSLVRVKLVATEIVRLDGQYDQEGNPVYVLNSTNVLVVAAPDDLKRKEG